MIDIKQLSGIMNLDDPNDVMLPFHHKFLMNGRLRGAAGNMRVESVPGNILIPNYLLPSGTNQCIGGFYDQVKRRIIWFNYNSNGNNGIYQYNTSTKVVSKIFLCGTDSATDILNFDLDLPIHSAVLVYRTESDGDLLWWTDGSFGEGNRPRCINIDTVSTLAPFTEDMINAGKNAPVEEPAAEYQDDSTRTSNNVRKQLFQFAYRWVYKSLEKSTLSPFSKLALPVNGYDVDTQNDPTKNNNILIVFQTGGNDFQKVEILGRVSEGTEFGDFFSIITLDRDDYNFNPSSPYSYAFYNDGNYTIADVTDADVTYSYLPDKANTLELLNGNVIIYGGITDGYDALVRSDVNVVVGSGSGSADIPSFSFAYSGAHDITCLVGSTIVPGTTYHIEFTYSSGAGGDTSPKNVNYVTLGGDTQNSIVNAIIALLNGNNISCTNLGAGYFRVITTTGTGSITAVVTTVSTAGTAAAAASWKPSCNERLGLIYFDERGKTNGVVYFPQNSIDTNVFDTNTPVFTVASNVVQVPYLTGSIDFTPPEWAVEFQWVRVPMTPKFLQWITNDYQTDTDFLYLCIQNLTYTQSKTSGYVPTYDFAKGDRIKVLAKFDSGTGFYTPYNLQLDMEVLGVENRTMTSPASSGRFVKVAKPTTFPSLAYSSNMLIELYTPYLRVSENEQVFYEWGERYSIYTYSVGVRLHTGQIDNQTPTQPATFRWYDGDIYFKERQFYLNVGDTTTVSVFMFDANYSDYFPSSVNSNGRGWTIIPDAAETYNPVQLRWGGKYQQDTNINDLNLFQPADFDTIDRAKGAICRLLAEERLLYVYQQHGVGNFGIYAKYIANNEGNIQLVTTNEIITRNNINYLQGTYGLGNQPCAVWRGKGESHFFVYDVRGDLLRRSGDGITNLSEIYYGQYTIRDLVTKYNKPYLRPDGSRAKIFGFYDYFENNSQSIFQEGTYSGKSIGNYNLSFHDANEDQKGFRSFYEYFPDWALQAEDITYSWKNGQLYIHNDEVKRCNFYNVQYYPAITLVFNKDSGIMKSMNSIGYQSEGKIWTCSELSSFQKGENIDAIITSTVDAQTGFRQSSRLKDFDFSIENYKTTAGLLRDINSGQNGLLALNEGSFLVGSWIQVKFKYNGSDYVFMQNPYLNFSVSNRNF